MFKYTQLQLSTDRTHRAKVLGIFSVFAVTFGVVVFVNTLPLGFGVSAVHTNTVNAAIASSDISCIPVQVSVFANAARLHVRCAAAVGGISYFALSTTDAALAARVLSILTTAQVAGRTLGIRYDPADTSGAAIGCQTNDCRLILEVWLGQ